MDTWQMWYMHWTENPANEVQFLEYPLWKQMVYIHG